MYWSKQQKEDFKIHWATLNKQEILNLYPNYTYQKLKDRARHYKVKKDKSQNHHKLKKLLEENLYNYYWYGFILGDGHITNSGELKILLSQEDTLHLQKLANYLDKNIVYKKSNNFGKYISKPTCYLGIKDVIYGKLLIDKFKIINPKTYNPCSLECLDDMEKFLSFLIGYIDADGYIDKKMIRIQNHSSWLKNLEYFSYKLKSINISSKTFIDNRGYSTFVLYKIKNISFLYDFAKLNNLPYLERKWSKLDCK